MVLTKLLTAGFALAMVSSAAAQAADYRPDDFLSLDSTALLSPKPLGPPAEFAKLPVEAKSEPANEAQTSAERVEVPKKIATQRVVTRHRLVVARHRPQLAHATPHKPHPPAKVRLAQHHRTPLDAQARDTRIQRWPCNTGGICGWK